MRFSQLDRPCVTRLVYDPTCEPSYDIMKACLVWPDERPDRISNDGYELVGDLWIFRGFLHRGVPRHEWGLNPDYFETVWKNALDDVPCWPGFRRIELSSLERLFLEGQIREIATTRDY
jgi:hypothetical protein